MDRCKLTILLEPGQEGLAEFLAEHQVEIVASLPCYLEDNVDKQRGDGVFQRSIQGLKKLNALGYGKEEGGLLLNLVYNPVGPSLPPAQAGLENDYKRELQQRFGIVFNGLYTITNLPISRFVEQLQRRGELNSYMTTLTEAFNPGTVDNVMCRNLISVSWTGDFYDCDFNQMLEMRVPGKIKTIWDLDALEEYQENRIATGPHCFGCTAGAGSSCGGSLT